MCFLVPIFFLSLSLLNDRESSVEDEIKSFHTRYENLIHEKEEEIKQLSIMMKRKNEEILELKWFVNKLLYFSNLLYSVCCLSRTTKRWWRWKKGKIMHWKINLNSSFFRFQEKTDRISELEQDKRLFNGNSIFTSYRFFYLSEV